jgi:hypothetical protein
MRLITIIILGLGALAASASVSRAEDGCGRGWYWDGRACLPMRAEPWQRNERRDYGRHHDYERHHDYDEPRNQRRSQYYPPDRRRWHTSNGCQPHYTVQDGLCKPYRGY